MISFLISLPVPAASFLKSKYSIQSHKKENEEIGTKIILHPYD